MKEGSERLERILKEKYETIAGHLTEKGGRIWAGMEARSIGYGGKAIVHRATGLDYKTIRKGLGETEEAKEPGIVKENVDFSLVLLKFGSTEGARD